MNYQRISQSTQHINRQQDDWDEVHNQLLAIQKKSFEVSNPCDADEQEADEVAQKVVQGQSAEIHGTGGTINRKGEGAFETTPEFQSKLESSNGNGQFLPENLQTEMGSKMGADFSNVKIHTGNNANEMNESVNAKAFAHGQDIYFKNGNYNPDSKDGKELLAHELVHTKQQEKIGRKIQRQPVPQTPWENDKSLSGEDLIYNTEAEAKARKAEIEPEGKWEEYAVESFTKDSKTLWRVHMRGTRTMVNFITELRKAETAYPSWTKEQMLNSLRRLAGNDDVNFQGMYGTVAATNLVPVPALGFTADDVQKLRDMLVHTGNDENETGLVKDFSGQYLAMGHVLTGISGGLHRNKDYDPAAKVRPWYAPAAGENVDNLYAVTLAGDLGQSATLVNEGTQSGYVGSGTEATDAELAGDIDGLIIGEALGAVDYKKKWNNANKLSDFIESYYKTDYKKRFEKVKKFDQNYLLDQTTRFAVNYSDKIHQKEKFTAATREVGTESLGAYSAYAKWLSKKNVSAEKTKPLDKLVITADKVLLVSDPGNYLKTIICRLMNGTEVRSIDEGEKMSFNQVVDNSSKWTKVLVLSGENQGKTGWVSRLFLK